MNVFEAKELEERAATPEMEDRFGPMAHEEELAQIWLDVALKELDCQPEDELWQAVRDKASALLHPEYKDELDSMRRTSGRMM